MSEAATSTPRSAEEQSQADKTTGDRGQGWLERVLARIGFGDSPEGVREMIEEALEKDGGTEEGFSPQERAMLVNLLRFGDLRIEDVMVPRADITAVEEQTPLGELLEMFQKAGHSRLPVFRGTLDNPRGMVHIKDLMSWITRQALAAPEEDKAAAGNKAKANAARARKKNTIRLERVDVTTPLAKAEILRDVLFVPPSMSVRDLLLRMQTTHVHLALVVDEYGGTDGLVSIEDLVEEIVGEIEDEHDRNGGPLIAEDPDRGLVADARAPIQELEEHLGMTLMPPEREEDLDTLGGLVFTLAGRIPVRGEVVRHDGGVEFEVLEADPRRIRKIRVHRKRSDGGPS